MTEARHPSQAPARPPALWPAVWQEAVLPPQAGGPGTAAAAAPLLRSAHRCPLCHQAVGPALRPDSRCPHCDSPLAPPLGPGQLGAGQLGRRGAVRRDQSHVAMLHLGWPSVPLPVRWRDLSLTGLSLYAPLPIAAGQRLRLVDSALDVVAEVVDCRPQGRLHAVHARMLSALLLQTTGVFVSAQA